MDLPRRLPNSRYKDHVSNIEGTEHGRNLIYVLWCPFDKRIKYIGYTNSPPWSRLQGHINDAMNIGSHCTDPKRVWLKTLNDMGLTPTMRLIRCFKRKTDAYQCEAELIQRIGLRRELLNRSKGHPNWKPLGSYIEDENGKMVRIAPWPFVTEDLKGESQQHG